MQHYLSEYDIGEIVCKITEEVEYFINKLTEAKNSGQEVDDSYFKSLVDYNLQLKNGDVISQDCAKALKRAAAFLMHDDKFKGVENYDSMVYSRFNGHITDITNYMKNSPSGPVQSLKFDRSAFYADEKEEQYQNGSSQSYSNGRQQGYRPNGYEQSHSSYDGRQQGYWSNNGRNESHNNNERHDAGYKPNDDEKDVHYYDDEPFNTMKNRFSEVVQYCVERFNASFRNIPTTDDDYENIKSYYEKCIAELQSDINVTTQNRNYLFAKMKQLKREKEIKTSASFIDEVYQKRLSDLYTDLYIKRDNEDKMHEILMGMYYEKVPLIDSYVSQWRYTKDITISRFERNKGILDFQMNCRPYDPRRMPDEELAKLYQAVVSDRNLIYGYYENEEAYRESIGEQICFDDPKFANLHKQWTEMGEQADRAENAYTSYYNNAANEKAEIKRKYSEAYDAEIRSKDAALERKNRKISNLNRRLDIVRDKYNKWLDTYSKKFSDDSGSEKARKSR